MEHEMTIIIGKLRDIWMNGNEPVIVIESPKISCNIIREHLNVRQRDILNNAHIDQLHLGMTIQINGELGTYMHNGKEKKCVRKIQSIKKV
jgi:hypothetical protein